MLVLRDREREIDMCVSEYVCDCQCLSVSVCLYVSLYVSACPKGDFIKSDLNQNQCNC